MNPHIGFTAFIQGKYDLRLPPTQPILPNWSNKTSIYYYNSLQEFEDFITGLEGGKEQDIMKIYDVLHKIHFREISNLPKDTSFLQYTLGELKANHTLIEEIYDSLFDKKITKMGPPTKLALPFDTRKAIRRKAIEARIKQLGISCQLVKYKQEFGIYKSEDQEDDDGSIEGNMEVPYFYETTVVHSNEHSVPAYLDLTEAINSSTMPNN
ncbi:MAG TPA: hypothetical protein VKA95_05230, partial [Nitrososphaeraceae archaeon]|nr:hypothetical protein [Nitrososphaeraceae archaeon]